MGCGIYRIDIGRHYYFGRAKNLDARRKDHINTLNRQCHRNSRMQRAFSKHNEFNFTVIARCPEEYLDKLEAHFINQHFGKPDCMNLVTTGEEGQYVWSKETIRKRSASRTGRTLSPLERKAVEKGGKANSRKCLLINPAGFPLLFESQTDAAEVLGITVGHLSNYFRGQNPWPPLDGHSAIAGWTGERLELKYPNRANAPGDNRECNSPAEHQRCRQGVSSHVLDGQEQGLGFDRRLPEPLFR